MNLPRLHCHAKLQNLSMVFVRALSARAATHCTVIRRARGKRAAIHYLYLSGPYQSAWFPTSERSAARLAHRSGGPGVGSSNLPAPTISPFEFQCLPSEGTTPLERDLGTKQRDTSRTGARNPEIIPKNVRRSFACFGS